MRAVGGDFGSPRDWLSHSRHTTLATPPQKMAFLADLMSDLRDSTCQFDVHKVSRVSHKVPWLCELLTAILGLPATGCHIHAAPPPPVRDRMAFLADPLSDFRDSTLQSVLQDVVVIAQKVSRLCDLLVATSPFSAPSESPSDEPSPMPSSSPVGSPSDKSYHAPVLPQQAALRRANGSPIFKVK